MLKQRASTLIVFETHHDTTLSDNLIDATFLSKF